MEKTGIYILKDGGVYYGDLDENGIPHSSDGSCTWANGTSYVGCWTHGEMSGIGTLYELGQVKYRGFWWEGELIHIFGTEELPKSEDKLPKNKNKIAALLIGCNYEDSDKPLSCCVNEVNEIEKKLCQIGVDVVVLRNPSKCEIEMGLDTLASKAANHDHALFYFSGHGIIYGGYHLLQGADGEHLALETNVVGGLYESNFKNIIIVHDACNSIAPITKEEIDNLHNQEQMLINNHIHSRNILYAFSSLNGNPSFASQEELGMFALAFIENIQKKNIPVVKMFDNISRFVLDYSNKTHGCYLETPNVNKGVFDDDFCFYDPIE